MSVGNIKDKFIKPLGPYIAHEILEHSATRRFCPDKFYLESVSFRQGSKQVGIDDVDNKEFGDGNPVLFRGVLTIVDKRWLNDVGKDWLQSDIDSRAGASYLKLDDCIKNNHVKALIQDVLGTMPRYLINTDDLRIFSFRKAPDATYEYSVSSMNVHTYSRSRKFLSKYKALRIIEDIVKADNELPRGCRTPLEGRSPTWLVEKYRETVRERYEKKRSSPSHAPRHIHRSEVYALFGRHATWLSETIKNHKLLNWEAWSRFCMVVRSRRKGMKPEEDELEDWDELERLWGVPEVPESPPEEQMDVDPPGEDEDGLEYVSTHSSDVPIEGTKSRSISPEPDYPLVYSGVRKETDEKKYAIGDPDVLSAIPKPFFCNQPVLQRNMKWYCPDLVCSYSLDFLHLPDEVLEGLNYSSRSYMCSHNWKVTDEEFIELFYDIVEHHYFKHLEDNGIKVVGFGSEKLDIFNQPILQERRITKPRELRTDDHPKFKWIKPGNHKPAFYHIHTDDIARTQDII